MFHFCRTKKSNSKCNFLKIPSTNREILQILPFCFNKSDTLRCNVAKIYCKFRWILFHWTGNRGISIANADVVSLFSLSRHSFAKILRKLNIMPFETVFFHFKIDFKVSFRLENSIWLHNCIHFSVHNNVLRVQCLYNFCMLYDKNVLDFNCFVQRRWKCFGDDRSGQKKPIGEFQQYLRIYSITFKCKRVKSIIIDSFARFSTVFYINWTFLFWFYRIIDDFVQLYKFNILVLFASCFITICAALLMLQIRLVGPFLN